MVSNLMDRKEDIILGSNPSSSSISPVPPLKRGLIIDEDIAAKIILDICNGIYSIHKNDYIHRDLKPENILLNRNNSGHDPEDFVAKIADFGLTAEADRNLFSNNDKVGTVTGTILFMAPEQATGQRYGKRVDMWAIGIIMF
jgi:serine/threonine protein kinase